MISKTLFSLMLAAVLCSCSVANKVFNGKVINSNPDSPIENRTISVKKVDEINSSRGIKVVYTQGNSTSVTLSAPADIADYIAVEMKGSSLQCGIDSDCTIGEGKDRVVVNVVSPKVKYFGATTGATIQAESLVFDGKELELSCTTGASLYIGSIKCSSLDCTTTTAGIITVNEILCSHEVDADCTTGGTLNLSGKASSVDFSVSTGGTINASKLNAYKGEAVATTGGTIVSNVGELSISTSSGGNVNNR